MVYLGMSDLKQEQKRIHQVNNQSRYDKGVVIAASRRIFKIKGEEAWLVESETTDDKFYKVTEDGVCECPDSQYRGQVCKHTSAILRSAIQEGWRQVWVRN
jgi:hypothetical protein